MHTIRAVNVNDAYHKGLLLLNQYGQTDTSRAGDVIVAPFPVTTCYKYPKQRVLFDANRDANPFFHLMESLWMLAGKNDARWLDHFVSNFSARFAEEGGIQHGAYGARWRTHFILDSNVEDLEMGFDLDQLDRIVDMLRSNPNDRRVVLQMWDPEVDLGAKVADVPCNLCVLPRIIDGALDITVFCRSNDAIWGAYGANAVHFSVLQEYLAARIGVQVGTYYQISNNFHAYSDIFYKKSREISLHNPYDNDVKVTPIVTHPDAFDEDLKLFFAEQPQPPNNGYTNPFFSEVAVPMFYSYLSWKAQSRDSALYWMTYMPLDSDWRVACMNWYSRRMEK